MILSRTIDIITLFLVVLQHCRKSVTTLHCGLRNDCSQSCYPTHFNPLLHRRFLTSFRNFSNSRQAVTVARNSDGHCPPATRASSPAREFRVIVLKARKKVPVHVERHLDRAVPSSVWSRFGEKPRSIAHEAKKWRSACIPYFAFTTGLPSSSFSSGSSRVIPAACNRRREPSELHRTDQRIDVESHVVGVLTQRGTLALIKFNRL